MIERYMLTHETGKVDWGEIWRTVREVTPDEWASLKHHLKQTYQRLLAMMRGFESWDDESRLGGALAMAAHAAYHLGEIRQALCILK